MEQTSVAAVIGIIAFFIVFWAGACALIYRFTARFTLGEPISLSSGFVSALIGMPIFAGLFSGSIAIAVAQGVQPGSAPIAAIGLAALAAAFFGSSIPNRFLMRRISGGRLTFWEACRVQIAPTLLIFAMALLSRS